MDDGDAVRGLIGMEPLPPVRAGATQTDQVKRRNWTLDECSQSGTIHVKLELGWDALLDELEERKRNDHLRNATSPASSNNKTVAQIKTPSAIARIKTLIILSATDQYRIDAIMNDNTPPQENPIATISFGTKAPIRKEIIPKTTSKIKTFL